MRHGLYLPDLTERRAALLPLEDALSRAFDPHAFVRDAYLPPRAYLVADGNLKSDEEPPPEPEALDVCDPEQSVTPARRRARREGASIAPVHAAIPAVGIPAADPADCGPGATGAMAIRGAGVRLRDQE